MKNKNVAIILASGSGKRMNSDIPKQYLLIKDKPIIFYTIEKFQNNQLIDEIILVVRESEKDYVNKEIISKYNFSKVIKLVTGGNERQNSVYNGLRAVDNNTEIVLIHDGVRPFVTQENICSIVAETKKYRACILGVKVIDTVKICDEKGVIIDTPNRDFVWQAQTPQCFSYKLVLEAHENAIKNNFIGSDDSVLVEQLGISVKIIEGNYDNIKITTQSDFNRINNLMGKSYL